MKGHSIERVWYLDKSDSVRLGTRRLKNTSLLHRIQPEYGDEQAGAGRDCRTRLTRPDSQARTNADRKIFLFPVQLTTSRIDNLTRLIHTLAINDDHTSGKKWQEGRLKEKSQIIQHKRDPWVRGWDCLRCEGAGKSQFSCFKQR